MKKIIACFLFFTLLLTVSGCGNETVEQPEYLTLTPDNIEQYVRITVNTADEVSNERVEEGFRLGNSKVQVTIVPIDPTRTVIDSMSVSVYIDKPLWSVDDDNPKEMTPVVDGYFMTSFILEAESLLTGTSLDAPQADDVIVTITSVNGTHHK